MGQGASTPQGDERPRNRLMSAFGSSERNRDSEMADAGNGNGNGNVGGGEGSMDPEERTRNLRRSRRLRSHIAQWTSLSSRRRSTALLNNEDTSTSRSLARIQNRIDALEASSNSPPGSRPASLRASRARSSLRPYVPSGSRDNEGERDAADPMDISADDTMMPARPVPIHRQTSPDEELLGTGRSTGISTGLSQDAFIRRASYGGTPNPALRSRFSRVRSSLSSIPQLFGESSSSSRTRPLTSSSRRLSYLDALQDREDMDLDLDPIPDLRASTSSSEENDNSGSQNEGNENFIRTRTGEDQQAVLSRLLSVAAAMTAASLVGSNEQAMSEARDVGNDNDNGTFEQFLRTLQSGRLAAALRNGGSENGGGMSGATEAEGGALAPLNFFRMFRFGPSSNSNNQTEADGTPTPRMVPVVIVGIRSVNGQNNEENAANNNTAPFFDALPTWTQGSGRQIPPLSRSRLGSNRRASSSDGLRHRRHSRTSSEPISPNPSSALASTAERDDEDASRAHDERSDFDRSSLRTDATATEEGSTQANGSSGSTEGDGSSRRGSNTSSRRPTEGTRSWIIYVLGGSYPENHPILTTPSLFTDSPSYEDMLLLSSLIGPAKPPVATREDVEKAGGVFTLAENMEDERRSSILGERCLICLSDFEVGEECRQITTCTHIYHKDCIDEWLTTGRNTCPLCRGEGVERKQAAEPSGSTTATTAEAEAEATVGEAPSAAAS